MTRGKGHKETGENPKPSLGFSVRDIFRDKSHIEIISNTTVNIEGSKGVLEYSDTVIRVSLGYTSVSFFGRGLNLKCISPTALVIEGFIMNIEFNV